MEKRRAHELTGVNKQARLDRSRLLLRRYPASLVHFFWFTDEKLFTVASPGDIQNDRLYTYSSFKLEKELLQPTAFYAHVRRLANP